MKNPYAPPVAEVADVPLAKKDRPFLGAVLGLAAGLAAESAVMVLQAFGIMLVAHLMGRDGIAEARDLRQVIQAGGGFTNVAFATFASGLAGGYVCTVLGREKYAVAVAVFVAAFSAIACVDGIDLRAGAYAAINAGGAVLGAWLVLRRRKTSSGTEALEG